MRGATFAELTETWERAGQVWNVATVGMEPKPDGPPWVRAEMHLAHFKLLLRMKGLRIAPHHACTGANADTVPFEQRHEVRG